jgi:HSP20 family molecular chaperone IbpA
MPHITSVGRSTLARQIRQLSASFAQLRDSEGVAAGSEFPPKPADDDYLYLEVEVPGHDDLEVDISIWDGRAVIRVGR